MDLVRLIYVSRRTDKFKQGDVKLILDSARRNNAASGISGALYIHPNYFIQWLEGEKFQIESTYNRILVDPRHRDNKIIDYTPVKKREFFSWSMGFLGEIPETSPIIRQIFENSTFEPYNMSGEDGVEFLLALRDLAPMT